jgi:DNA primase
MTVLADGDVRGFYAALNIDLPGWADRYASTTCFAAPEEHTNGDRSPSTSVNLSNGRYRCWGCGARGGAYDAALIAGHTPRSAMELLITYGLAERRQGPGSSVHPPVVAHRRASAPKAPPPRPGLKIGKREIGDADVAQWVTGLAERPTLVGRICRARGWQYAAMRKLELGIEVRIEDGTERLGRLTIPVRNADGELRGVLRYRLPWRSFGTKMVTASGTRLGLIPHPAREPSTHVILVEGPPDAIAARSHGLPAIAVPGTDAWKPDWAALLAGRTVTVIMDADRVGRAAAARIQNDLDGIAQVTVVDLAPGREDGYDLTDALRDARQNETVAAEPPAALGILQPYRAAP